MKQFTGSIAFKEHFIWVKSLCYFKCFCVRIQVSGTLENHQYFLMFLQFSFNFCEIQFFAVSFFVKSILDIAFLGILNRESLPSFLNKGRSFQLQFFFLIVTFERPPTFDSLNSSDWIFFFHMQYSEVTCPFILRGAVVILNSQGRTFININIVYHLFRVSWTETLSWVLSSDNRHDSFFLLCTLISQNALWPVYARVYAK